jgi:V8-like Glu-specific endopeptidase
VFVKRRVLAMARTAFLSVNAMVISLGISKGQPASPSSRRPHHFGEIADPSQWPVSAVGTITVPWHTNLLSKCTGALVAPKIVLTAAHCLSPGGQTVRPQAVHFSAGLNRGVPSSHSVAERLEIGEGYNTVDEGSWTNAGADWALVFLKEAIPIKPVAVRAASADEVRVISGTESAFQVGFGLDRPYLPSIVRRCRVGKTSLETVIQFQCLANFGYSGAPIFFDFDGQPAIVGIGSRGSQKPDPDQPMGFACSAAGFAKRVAELAGPK